MYDLNNINMLFFSLVQILLFLTTLFQLLNSQNIFIYLNDLNITNTQALGYGGKEEMPNITLWSYLWRDQVHQHIIITLKT
jgi:hypothetical protein